MARNMVGLLTPVAPRDLRYEPPEASSSGISLLVILLGAAAVATLLTSHFLPRLVLVVLAAGLVNNLPFIGYTYLLTRDELFVFRFGRERLRLPLAHFKRTGALVHMPYLVFTERRVWLPGSAVVQFLAEVGVRAMHLGSASLAAQRLDDTRVRLPLLQLVLPTNCVVCGEVASGSVSIPRARHLDFVPRAEVRAPVCSPHRTRLKLARTFWNVTTFLVAGGVTAGLLSAQAGSVWYGIALLSFGAGAVASAVLGRFGLEDWSDERVLGLRLTEMSADQQSVVLRIRPPALRDEVIRLTDERVRSCLDAVEALGDSPR